MKWLLALVLVFCSSAALAQGCGPANPNCVVPTVQPFSANDNRAASTAFVQGAIGGGGVTGITVGGTAVTGGVSGQCLSNNAGVVGTLACSGGSGAVSSVSNSDGSLTVSPTTGAVVASVNVAHSITWAAPQTFPANDLILSGVTGSTQCLQVNSSGVVTGTGAACGSGGGGAVNSVTNTDGSLSISPTTGAVVASLNVNHSITWGATQTFPANDLILSGVTGSTQCLQANSSGVVTGTGSACGAGGGGGTITIGTTPIASGTSGRLLYDNSAIVGEAIIGSGLSLAGGTLSATGGGAGITTATLDLDFPVYSTALANVTGLTNSLSVNVSSGQSYVFTIGLRMFSPSQTYHFVSPAANSGGIAVALGGTATLSYLSINGSGMDDTTPIPVRSTVAGLGQPIILYMSTGTKPTATLVGVMTAAASGTVTVQFAQAASGSPLGSGVRQGSYIQLIPTTITGNTGLTFNRFSAEATGPNAELSNGNLTATKVNSANSVTVLTTNMRPRPTDTTPVKLYAEFTVSSGSVSNCDQRFGFAAPGQFITEDLGFSTDSLTYTICGTSFQVFWNSALITTYTGYAAFTNATVFRMCIDLTNHLVWGNAGTGNWNGSSSANPSTGVGGLSFAPVLPGSANASVTGPYLAGVEPLDVGSVITANFGSSTYAFPPASDPKVTTAFGNW